jgi:hypothetical protein
MRLNDTASGVADEAEQLDYGISLGLAPQPELDGEVVGGVTVTRLSSWWNHLRCRRCGHTFRRGDTVRLDHQDRSAVHLVPGLRCGAEAGEDSGQELMEFRDGLLSAWPAPGGLRVHRLAAGDWRLPTGPDDRRRINVCLHCGHTFRPGEYVVVCPCWPAAEAGQDGPQQPAGCGRSVHRDPATGLSCWESWRPDGTVTVCPVTQVTVRPGVR